MTNVDIFIPARLDSKRLPKKHLLKINEKPIIKHIVDRLSSCKTIRNIVVCTTTLETDDELIDYLINEKILGDGVKRIWDSEIPVMKKLRGN